MKKIIFSLFVLISGSSYAQQSFSLEQALEFSTYNSYNVKLSEIEQKSAIAKVKETIGTGLPQINGNASYQNFIKQPVQVVPAEFFGGEPGEFQPVVFGTKQNLTADITAQQLIFDGSYLVGLKAAQEVVELFELQKEKSILEVKKDVSNAYFMVLVADKSAEVLEQSLDVLKKLSEDQRAMYKEGFASESDADQLDINYINLKNNYEYAKTQKTLALLLLKYRMGIAQEDDIILTDKLEQYTQNTPLLESNSDLENTNAFSLVKKNIELQTLNRKALQAQYLPSLNGFFTTQQQAFDNEFSFFSSDADYFASTFFGLNLKVPIFSGLNKHNKIKQAKYEEFKAKVNALQVKEGIKLDYRNAEANLNYQFKNFKNQERSLELAKSIRSKTLIKFQEGLSSSFEISQSEQQLLDAQNTYTQAILNYLQALTNIKYLTNQF